MDKGYAFSDNGPEYERVDREDRESADDSLMILRLPHLNC